MELKKPRRKEYSSSEGNSFNLAYDLYERYHLQELKKKDELLLEKNRTIVKLGSEIAKLKQGELSREELEEVIFKYNNDNKQTRFSSNTNATIRYPIQFLKHCEGIINAILKAKEAKSK